MAQKRWKPNDFLYDQVDGEYKGVALINAALAKAKFEYGDEIVTSKDPRMLAAQKNMEALDMPTGIDKRILPIVKGGNRPVFTFITVGNPNAVVPRHVHKDECIWRLIVSGSIIIEDTELTQGDWLYIPRAKPYSYTVGPNGCIILHEYNGTALWGWEKKEVCIS
jgi:hypothetical protein